VQRTVHLDDDPAAIGSGPLGVEVAAAAAGLNSGGLASGHGQARTTAEADEVDLTHGVGTLRDVVDGRAQELPVPRP
jgi:hypothetical protein